MRVTFDPKKDAINRRKHGISLQRAEYFDFDSANYDLDDSQDYGEDRWNAVSWLDARLYTLTFVPIEEQLVRPISLRVSTKQEREKLCRSLENMEYRTRKIQSGPKRSSRVP